jgi:hypothetical protein
MADEPTIVLAKRKIRWEPAQQEEPAPSLPDSEPPISEQPDIISKPVFVQTKSYNKHVGNGHKSTKVRNLLNSEKDSLHDFFYTKNGEIENDDCVAYKANHDWYDVGIFQITGYVSVLHTEVASGIIQLKNLVSYEQWMRIKYGETLWARYNFPLYVKTRAINATLISQGLPTVKANEVKKSSPDPIPYAKSIQKFEKDLSTLNQASPIIKPSLVPKFTAFRRKYAGAS